MPRKFRRVYEKLDLVKKFTSSYFQGSKYEEFYGDIEKYCMFIGYPRSGHSLVGSLLDAHQNMIIAHELDALKYLDSGFSRKQLYQQILENSIKFNETDREWTGYSYWVPNQWHGRFSELKIIGDKKGSRSVLRFMRNPGILQKLRDEIEIDIKFIHVTRNPFDNISRMFLKSRAKKKITSQDPCSLSVSVSSQYFLAMLIRPIIRLYGVY